MTTTERNPPSSYSPRRYEKERESEQEDELVGGVNASLTFLYSSSSSYYFILVFRLKLDKENVHHAKSPPKKTTPSSYSNLKMTPPRKSPPIVLARTPPGSSKLLRKHFQQQQIMTSLEKPSASASPSPSASTIQKQRRRRLLDAGPIRLLTPSRMMDAGAVRLLHPTPRRRTGTRTTTATTTTTPLKDVSHRIGIDGTPYTPSKELLQSTHASRHQQLRCSSADQYNHHHHPPHPQDDAVNKSCSSSTSTDFSFVSLASLTSPRRTPPRRLECMDPVAFTLLRGGDEDPAWLWEQDRGTSASNRNLNLSHRYSSPKAVSSNFADVHCGDHVISRPVPLMARRQF
jgi:hypothetical protein